MGQSQKKFLAKIEGQRSISIPRQVLINTKKASTFKKDQFLELVSGVITNSACKQYNDYKEVIERRVAILSKEKKISLEEAHQLIVNVSSHDSEVFLKTKEEFAKTSWCRKWQGMVFKLMAMFTREYGFNLPLPAVSALTEFRSFGDIGKARLFDKVITKGCLDAASNSLNQKGEIGVPLSLELKSMLFEAEDKKGPIFLHFMMPANLKMPGQGYRVDDQLLSSLLKKHNINLKFKNNIVNDYRVAKACNVEPGSLNFFSLNHFVKSNRAKKVRVLHLPDKKVFLQEEMLSNIGWPTKRLAVNYGRVLQAQRINSSSRIKCIPLSYAEDIH